MAIKDQCLNCKHISSENRCNIKIGYLMYDGSSCNEYEKRVIDLSKHDMDTNQYNVNPPNPNITPTQQVKKGMFQHPFSFSGRIRRTEYCLTYFGYFLFFLPMDVMKEDEISGGFALIWLLLLIPVVWILLAQGSKRCHDRDNSGWYQLIPFYGLWMLFAEGDQGMNYYGDSPK